MGVIQVRNAWIFCHILLLGHFCSAHTKTGASDCDLRTHWINRIFEGGFDALQGCGDLNFILQHVYEDKKHDYCSAERQHVLGYIREGLRANFNDGNGTLPEDCAIERWWYEDNYRKGRVAFCKNATAIATAKGGAKKKKALSRTQPFLNLIHGPRTTCHNKLRGELATIGNPDVAGWGVMASYLIQLILATFFSLAAFCRDGSRIRRRAEKSFSIFYSTSMILNLSIAIASGITFVMKRAAPSSIRSDLRFPEIYEYRLLTMAPAFAVLPVLVAHTLYEAKQQTGEASAHRRRLIFPRASAAFVCLLSVVVVWVIWFVGDQGRQSPVGVVFGGRLDIRVNDFLYQRAGKYTLAIACLTTALVCLGILVSALLSLGTALPVLTRPRGAGHGTRGHLHQARWFQPESGLTQQPRLKWPGSSFCVVCLLLALTELTMLFYIRTLAIEDGQGQTSETEISFGQILACFTWFPVLLILAFGVELPAVNEARVEAQKWTVLS